MSIDKLLKEQDISQVYYEVKWHNYLRSWRKIRDKERGEDEFHASSLADKSFCLVKAILNEMTDVKDEIFSPRTLSVFMTGLNIHKKHQDFYRKTNIAYYTEQGFYLEFLDMFLTPDAIINFMNKTTVIEIKSMNTFQFGKLRIPPIGAYWQILIYMYAVGISQGIIVIEDKNSQEVKIFKVDFNLKKAIILISRRLAILKCLEKNMLPLSKRICKEPGQRKRCKFKDICFDRECLKEILRKNI